MAEDIQIENIKRERTEVRSTESIRALPFRYQLVQFWADSQSNLAARYLLTSSLTYRQQVFHALLNTYSG